MSTAVAEIELAEICSAESFDRVQPVTCQPAPAKRLALAAPTYPQPAINTLGISGRGNLDFAELIGLRRPHLFQANQFKQRQKGDNNLNTRHDLGEQIGKLQR